MPSGDASCSRVVCLLQPLSGSLKFAAVFDHSLEHLLALAHEFDLIVTWNKWAGALFADGLRWWRMPAALLAGCGHLDGGVA